MITTLWCPGRSPNIVLRAIHSSFDRVVLPTARDQQDRRHVCRRNAPDYFGVNVFAWRISLRPGARDRARGDAGGGFERAKAMVRAAGSRLALPVRTTAQTKTPPPEGDGVFVFEHRRGEFLVLGRPGSDLLSQGLSHSTIGAEAFNGRVRDGIGLRRFAKTTRPAKDKKYEASDLCWRLAPLIHSGQDLAVLWTLKMRAIKPIERLVPVSYMHYCTSTSGLSTWSSSTVLKGMLVLRWVSRLDAFSGYPVRT